MDGVQEEVLRSYETGVGADFLGWSLGSQRVGIVEIQAFLRAPDYNCSIVYHKSLVLTTIRHLS